MGGYTHGLGFGALDRYFHQDIMSLCDLDTDRVPDYYRLHLDALLGVYLLLTQVDEIDLY